MTTTQIFEASPITGLYQKKIYQVVKANREKAVQEAGIVIDRIMNHIQDLTGVPYADIEKLTRNRQVVYARHLLFYLLKIKTRLTLTQIGRMIGRDHTTVLHAIRSIENLMWSDPMVKADVEKLLSKS